MQELLHSEVNNFFEIVANTIAGIEEHNKELLEITLYNFQTNPPFSDVKSIDIGSNTQRVIYNYKFLLKDLTYQEKLEPEVVKDTLEEVFNTLTSLAQDSKLNVNKIESKMKEINDFMVKIEQE